MPKFSKTSKQRLSTCHLDLQAVFNELVKTYDCAIVSGMRTPAEQLALYKKGRTEPGSKVTNLDGYNKKSRHNYNPSQAVDVVPYPIDWNDIGRFKEMALRVKEIAAEKNINIQWGGDWNSFKDYPHWQIK